jgi:hypothetical protein
MSGQQQAGGCAVICLPFSRRGGVTVFSQTRTTVPGDLHGRSSTAIGRLRMYLRFFAALVLGLCAAQAVAHSSHDAVPSRPAPRPLRVDTALPPPPRGVEELRFRDVFKMPVGAYGLEATERLLSLDGKRVRVVGYMVRQAEGGAGAFALSPLPVTLGDADEGHADDLPPTALLVEMPARAALQPDHLSGLIQLTGVLRVGRAESAALPGRVFPARIELDEKVQKLIAKKNK